MYRPRQIQFADSAKYQPFEPTVGIQSIELASEGSIPRMVTQFFLHAQCGQINTS